MQAPLKMGYSIRLLKESDLTKGFFETLSDLTTVGEIAENIEKARQVFTSINNQKYILVAVNEQNEVIGTATILIEQKFIHNGSSVGHVEDVVVKKAYEGQGIGRGLLEKCIDIAKDNKCYKIILDCKESNQGFYSKFGFRKDCICLRLDL